ncbi:hypothetical protein MIND_00430000 [Mycena indigotica]|uniref:Uncharacterized protein n=1 Tax=Mycena indigotica TaxID=2126181 RepID=A0A8H6SUZ6_9AGAR|nr:uncharacterized protein MIND_00430000 [Mycena indigotica]KAF7306388.1 hypothetical protein MIND_00430000 [Mycena indigotica]
MAAYRDTGNAVDDDFCSQALIFLVPTSIATTCRIDACSDTKFKLKLTRLRVGSELCIDDSIFRAEPARTFKLPDRAHEKSPMDQARRKNILSLVVQCCSEIAVRVWCLF